MCPPQITFDWTKRVSKTTVRLWRIKSTECPKIKLFVRHLVMGNVIYLDVAMKLCNL